MLFELVFLSHSPDMVTYIPAALVPLYGTWCFFLLELPSDHTPIQLKISVTPHYSQNSVQTPTPAPPLHLFNFSLLPLISYSRQFHRVRGCSCFLPLAHVVSPTYNHFPLLLLKTPKWNILQRISTLAGNDLYCMVLSMISLLKATLSMVILLEVKYPS